MTLLPGVDIIDVFHNTLEFQHSQQWGAPPAAAVSDICASVPASHEETIKGHFSSILHFYQCSFDTQT